MCKLNIFQNMKIPFEKKTKNTYLINLGLFSVLWIV